MKFINIEDLRSIPEIEMLICSRNVGCKQNKPIFFYHIPKSAGISFKAVLGCAIRGKAFFSDYPWLNRTSDLICILVNPTLFMLKEIISPK